MKDAYTNSHYLTYFSAGEIWNWSLLGVEGLKVQTSRVRSSLLRSRSGARPRDVGPPRAAANPSATFRSSNQPIKFYLPYFGKHYYSRRGMWMAMADLTGSFRGVCKISGPVSWTRFRNKQSRTLSSREKMYSYLLREEWSGESFVYPTISPCADTVKNVCQQSLCTEVPDLWLAQRRSSCWGIKIRSFVLDSGGQESRIAQHSFTDGNDHRRDWNAKIATHSHSEFLIISDCMQEEEAHCFLAMAKCCFTYEATR